MSTPAGIMADQLELKYDDNLGRVLVLGFGVLLSSIAFLLQFLVVQDTYNTQIILLLLLFLRCIYAVGVGMTVPVLDGLTLVYLNDHDGCSREQFGKESLFGVIWWAVGSVCIGVLIDLYGFQVLYLTTSIGAVIQFLSLFIFWKFYSKGRRLVSDEDKSSCSSDDTCCQEDGGDCATHNFDKNNNNPIVNSTVLVPSTKRLSLILCGSVYGLTFLLSSIMLTMGKAVVENLVFLYFSDLGASNFLCGFSVVITVLFEIPIFHNSEKLLAKYGIDGMQILACLAYITRVMGYTMLSRKTSYLFLFLEPLHGVTFGCNKLAAVHFASDLSPKGYESTMQGVFGMLTGFVGGFSGLLLGGFLDDIFGNVIMYRSFVLIVTFGLIVFVMVRLKRREFRGGVSYGEVGHILLVESTTIATPSQSPIQSQLDDQP